MKETHIAEDGGNFGKFSPGCVGVGAKWSVTDEKKRLVACIVFIAITAPCAYTYT